VKAIDRPEELGQLMSLNQRLLSSILVSTSRLEELCRIAEAAGAYGAKLTGGGGGGCMIALVDESSEPAVLDALREAQASPFVATIGAATVSFEEGTHREVRR
jgi:mevalonate kinase